MHLNVDITKFGYKERRGIMRLLAAVAEQGLPSDFVSEEVRLVMDKGDPHLTNAEHEMAKMNGKTLQRYYICHECGHGYFKKQENKSSSSNTKKFAVTEGKVIETE